MSFIVLMVILIFVGAPLANALAERIAKGSSGRRAETAALRGRLEQTEGRLLETEERLASVEERLGFYERLLADPENRRRVRAGGDSG